MNKLIVSMAMSALIAGAFAVFSTPLVKKLAHRFGAVRQPRARDAHQGTMPLWGGLSMLGGFLVALLVMRLWTGHELGVAVGKGQHPILGIVLGAILVGVVGMIDDVKDLKPKFQILSLVVGGLIASYCGARIEGLTNPFAPLPSAGQYNSANWIELPLWISYSLTLIWVFLVSKTLDFLDGLDGLAAGVCVIAAGTMGLLAMATGKPDEAVALMAWALMGACLGFLRHNYAPASIFMGTVGAQFLGFVLAMLAVVGTFKVQAAISLLLPPLVLGVPIIDGLYVVGRRIAQGKNPTVADKTHIHHRLRDRGLTVRQSVWAVYGLMASCCALALFLTWFTRR